MWRALGLEEQGPSGPTSVFGEATVSFGESGEFAEVTVSDNAVATNSRILASVAYTAAPGRDLDELEMDSFSVMVGAISPAASFKIAVQSLQGPVHGDYLIHYERS